MSSQPPKPEAADLDALATAMPEGVASDDINELVRQLARLVLERRAEVRGYAPGAQYHVGNRVRFNEQVADVVAERRQYNPQQGSFSVVDLQMPGTDSVRRVVAGIASAPAIAPSAAVDEDAVAALVAAEGTELRKALLGDARVGSLLDAGASSAAVPPFVRSVQRQCARCTPRPGAGRWRGSRRCCRCVLCRVDEPVVLRPRGR